MQVLKKEKMSWPQKFVQSYVTHIVRLGGSGGVSGKWVRSLIARSEDRNPAFTASVGSLSKTLNP